MLEELLRDLNSRDPNVRQQAIQKARTLSADELFHLVQLEAADNSRRSGIGIIPILVCSLIFAGGGLVAYIDDSPIALLWCLFALFTAIGLMFLRSVPTRARTSLAAVFSEVDDARFVRILLDLLASGRNDAQGTNYLIRALTRQLPGMRTNHGSELSNNERKTLYTLLETRFGERKLMLGILKALEQIGNPDAIPAVSGFLTRLRSKLTRPDPELIQAAEDCLLFLNQKYAQTKQSQTLLRPSDASAHAPETLLRAVTSSPTTPPEELLRPQILIVQNVGEDKGKVRK
ncbi:MAG TPA: hypothetical protein VKU00_30070 [Chthonomonadaceae bacterium]|nr:hypothetical protein [Chthonomonadaceae bacterium]